MFIAVYMDDLLLFGTDVDSCIDNVMQNIQDKFWMNNLGDISHHLGIEVDINLNKKTISFQ